MNFVAVQAHTGISLVDAWSASQITRSSRDSTSIQVGLHTQGGNSWYRVEFNTKPSLFIANFPSKDKCIEGEETVSHISILWS